MANVFFFTLRANPEIKHILICCFIQTWMLEQRPQPSRSNSGSWQGQPDPDFVNDDNEAPYDLSCRGKQRNSNESSPTASDHERGNRSWNWHTPQQTNQRSDIEANKRQKQDQDTNRQPAWTGTFSREKDSTDEDVKGQGWTTPKTNRVCGGYEAVTGWPQPLGSSRDLGSIRHAREGESVDRVQTGERDKWSWAQDKRRDAGSSSVHEKNGNSWRGAQGPDDDPRTRLSSKFRDSWWHSDSSREERDGRNKFQQAGEDRAANSWNRTHEDGEEDLRGHHVMISSRLNDDRLVRGSTVISRHGNF